jgi:hypothetical protein
LVEKYRITYADNAREILQTETALAGMIESWMAASSTSRVSLN